MIKTREIFSDNLKSVIAKRGLNQKELSDLSGISQASISRYLNTLRTPDLITVGILCKALKTTPNELLRGYYER